MEFDKEKGYAERLAGYEKTKAVYEAKMKSIITNEQEKIEKQFTDYFIQKGMQVERVGDGLDVKYNGSVMVKFVPEQSFNQRAINSLKFQITKVGAAPFTVQTVTKQITAEGYETKTEFHDKQELSNDEIKLRDLPYYAGVAEGKVTYEYQYTASNQTGNGKANVSYATMAELLDAQP